VTTKTIRRAVLFWPGGSAGVSVGRFLVFFAAGQPSSAVVLASYDFSETLPPRNVRPAVHHRKPS